MNWVATPEKVSRYDGSRPFSLTLSFTSTAMTMSAPRSRATEEGRLSAIPPSAIYLPSSSLTGEKIIGRDMEPLSERYKSEEKTTLSPVTRSVPTARKVMGSSSKDETFMTRQSADRISTSVFLSSMTELVVPMPFLVKFSESSVSS